MLIFFVFVKLLSLMTITRERQSHYSGWETGRRGDACPLERTLQRVRDLHRNDAESSRLNR